MTVPELKSTVYLLPEVAWPIIKQNVTNTGNRPQCSDVTSTALETTDEILNVLPKNIMEHQDTNKKIKIRPMFWSLRMISFITGNSLRSDSELLPQMT